jgi:hypothetical protein
VTAAPHPSGDKCLCRACGCYFASTWSFDVHRAGPYSDRGCLDLESMKRAGFSLVSDGSWRVPG